MICYRKIDLEQWEDIAHQVYDFVLETSILETRHSWNTLDVDVLKCQIPDLFEAFGRLNLTVSNAAIIYRRPFYQGGVHIDSGTGIRALIPVNNCVGSYTKFFEINRSMIQKEQGMEQDVFYLVPNHAIVKEIASIETTTPFVFDPKIPHGVFTNPACTGPRLTLTVGFVEKITLI